MRIRAPAVAGLFYPDDEAELERLVHELVGQRAGNTHARVVLSPHAGYTYSGKVAAELFSTIHVPDRVVIIGPNHTGRGGANAVYAEGAFSMPGAKVPVDERLAAELMEFTGLRDDPPAHEEEHSIEVQVPFLLTRNPNVKIVPICLDQMSFRQCERLGQGLAHVLKERSDVLVVVTSDMSHYVAANEAERLDSIAMLRFKSVDPVGFYHVVSSQEISLCGLIPVTVGLVLAKELGVRSGKIVSYANSGDVTGDYQRVVGYASGVLA